MDSAVGITPPVALFWTPGANATQHDLFVWKDGDTMTVNPTAANLKQISYTYQTAFVSGAKYHWKVVVKNTYCVTSGAEQTFTLRELSNLVVSNVQAPVDPFSGKKIDIEYTITNIGAGETGMVPWYESVYLSLDTVFSPNIDLLLGSFPYQTALNPGQGYTKTSRMSLPDGILGDYYIFVKTDVYNSVGEAHETDNVSAPAFMYVNLSPYPDFRVTSVLTPNNAFTGTAITVQWTVKNNGTGPDPNPNSSDRIYISPSPVFNFFNAHYLGQLTYAGNDFNIIQPDSSITRFRQVVLPDTMIGIQYIYVLQTLPIRSMNLCSTETTPAMGRILISFCRRPPIWWYKP
ncbi:MAG: hypothetical protein IPM98_15675 [Lewinellaceae bacterium]|nr:hypothetical protein [Lewinellaceae bacterium]